MGRIPEGLSQRFDQWQPGVSNSRRPDHEQFASDMRGSAVTLLEEHGILERMPKHKIVGNAAISFFMGMGVGNMPEIGDETFVAAPVDLPGIHEVVAVTTWTFRSLKNADGIYVSREGTDNRLVLYKGSARVDDVSIVGLRGPNSQERWDWQRALHGLSATAKEHPELLLQTSPNEASLQFFNPVPRMVKTLLELERK